MNAAGTAPTALMRFNKSSLISVQCVIFGRGIRQGIQFLRSLVGCKHHINRDVAVRMTIYLNTGSVHALDPRIKVLLRFGHVAFVRWSDVEIRPADCIVRSENDPSAVCSEVAPNLIHSSPKPVMIPFAIIASSMLPLTS